MTAGEAVELHEHLLRLGFNPVKAQLWSEFLKHVLAIFRTAEAELRRPDNWDEFKKRRGALGKRYVRRRQKVTIRYPNEDAITTELGHIVQTLRRRLPHGHFLRANEVEFHVERPVRSASRAGRHSRKVDFFIFAASGISAPELAVEAKSVRTHSDITKRYLGNEGIGCFLESDSPYSRAPIGSMLAYSLADLPWVMERRDQDGPRGRVLSRKLVAVCSSGGGTGTGIGFQPRQIRIGAGANCHNTHGNEF